MGEKIKSFTDLNAWKEGHKLVLMIYKVTSDFPKHEIYCLVMQMRRAAISITSNTSERFSRTSAKEKRQFYSISAGSISELQNQLMVCKDVGYISKEIFDRIAKQTVTVSKLVRGLIKYTES